MPCIIVIIIITNKNITKCIQDSSQRRMDVHSITYPHISPHPWNWKGLPNTSFSDDLFRTAGRRWRRGSHFRLTNWRYRTMKRLCNMYSLDSEYTQSCLVFMETFYHRCLNSVPKAVWTSRFDTGLHNLNTNTLWITVIPHYIIFVLRVCSSNTRVIDSELMQRWMFQLKAICRIQITSWKLVTWFL